VICPIVTSETLGAKLETGLCHRKDLLFSPKPRVSPVFFFVHSFKSIVSQNIPLKNSFFTAKVLDAKPFEDQGPFIKGEDPPL